MLFESVLKSLEFIWLVFNYLVLTAGLVLLCLCLFYFLRDICICLGLFKYCVAADSNEANADSDERINSHEEYERSESQSTIITIQSARSSMEHYRRDARVDMPSVTKSEIARCALTALPPVKTFNGELVRDCPIFMEEFKKGELIQPFGLCAHEFHSSCLNSWLLGGKTTCLICRQDLSNTVCTSRAT